MNTTGVRYPIEIKEQAIQMYHTGMSAREVTEKLELGKFTLKNWLNNTKSYRKSCTHKPINKTIKKLSPKVVNVGGNLIVMFEEYQEEIKEHEKEIKLLQSKQEMIINFMNKMEISK